jgi:hypothetical protein
VEGLVAEFGEELTDLENGLKEEFSVVCVPL